MDRSSLFSRRLGLPAAGLILAGLWLALSGRSTLPNRALPIGRVQGSAVPLVAKPAAWTASAAVDPVQAQQTGVRSAPCAAWTVIATTFTGGQSAAPATAKPDDEGPLLVPSEPATSGTPSVAARSEPAKAVEPPSAPTPPALIWDVLAQWSQRPLPEAKPVEQAGRVAVPAPACEPPKSRSPDPAPVAPQAAGPRARSAQLESIAREADRHSRQGYDLARRGAHYAARREFITALRLVAEGLDMEQKTALHGRALGAALTALVEVEDFARLGEQVDPDQSVADVAARHRTPVLKGAAPLSPIEAMKVYFTFAQGQLATAAGGEVAGSMALHGLGKLHCDLAQQTSLRVRAAEPKAMTFFQASLLVDPQNFVASNDLGVMLARAGRYAEARHALEHSLAVRPQATGWRNLACVYRRLGEEARAARAEQLFQVAARAEAASQKSRTPAGVVEWVSPQAFAQTFAQTPDAREPLPARPAAGRPAPAPATGSPVAQNPFSALFEKRQ